ncbi:MAG: hypothetical protein ACP5HM_01585 [Anaerolineae bacterium]
MKPGRWLVVLVTLMLLGAMLGVSAVGAAPAHESSDEEVEVVGTVVTIDETNGILVIEVEAEDGETQTYTVVAPEDFNFEEIEVGSVVEVEGVPGEDEGVIVADTVQEETDAEEEKEGEEENDGVNFFCANSEFSHPAGVALAERYEVTYEQVMSWFCEDNLSFGQIMLALHTAQITGESPESSLERRLAGEGWGQIWQSLNLIGRREEVGPPDHAQRPENPGPADHAGPPEDVERPENPGPPDDAGPPENDGSPENPGPPDHAAGRGKGRGRSD